MSQPEAALTRKAIKTDRLAFVASDTDEAQEACSRLSALYGNVAPKKADVIVALGGDGLMLQTLHSYMGTGTPIYGMNRGSVGFLMNEYREEDLPARLLGADITPIHPLNMEVIDRDGYSHAARAINEVSIWRQTSQAARLRISVDNRTRLEELICDGCLVATPAGSTAYNLSAHGPILPISAPLLALTPISPFRPRRWRGALLPNKARVDIDVLDDNKRPVSASADHTEIRNVVKVSIHEDSNVEGLMMFDSDHGWDERILAEMFRY
ncbi:NAD kinase [Roseibium algae]|uniref:NAD kinase n=1 Tax=Roseibium algae TaxID=3123038 RepID=A0ABU8TN17_9HYPH